MNKWLISVPTLFGLEGLAAKEIRKLGYETEKVEDGRVSFFGDGRAVARANIWLRFGERVQIKLGDFSAVSFTELFDQTKALPWPSLLPVDAAFPVNGHCLSSKLGSVPDCQAIIKKAAVESMKRVYKADRFAETGAVYRINFNIIRDRATIYVDTSGDGLHKRGYRESATVTPIRETLAAALVELSGWRPGKALWDPFCGSGTIAAEAAMMAANRAPGLERRFAAEGWATAMFAACAEGAEGAVDVAGVGDAGGGAGSGGGSHDMKETLIHIFEEERERARAIYNDTYAGLTAKKMPVGIVGSDISMHCVRAARENAARAGVSKLVRFFQMDAKHMSPTFARLPELGVQFPERGNIVANPPYGERRDDLPEAYSVCREWAPALEAFRDWGWCVISSLSDFENVIGRNATKRRKLHNGKIKCQAFLYW